MDGALPLGFATLDLDRQERQGLPEVVYGPGKQPGQIAAIVAALLDRSAGPVLVTRLEPAAVAEVPAADSATSPAAAAAPAMADLADGAAGPAGGTAAGTGSGSAAGTAGSAGGAGLRRDFWPAAEYDASARLLCWRPAPPGGCAAAIVTAGTADGPVADEAAAVARAIGLRVSEFRDVGVAGLHRLTAVAAEIRAADVVIVIAGMEGALASVVAGLVGGPVVAVPTSTGYGAALEGITALLAMMTSCAAGVCVVNIDSGFSAAMAAHRLAFSLGRRDG
jgi:NCAIR mutase (PurE)-related protein